MSIAVKAVLVVVAVVLVALAIAEIVHERELRIKAEAGQATLQQAIQKDQEAAAAAQANQERTNADLKSQLAAIAAQRTVVVTPQQAAQVIPQFIPNLPAPVEVKPTPTPQDPKAESLVVPQVDIKAFQEYKLNCDETSARLTACSLNFADEQTKTSSLTAQLNAMQKQRDLWEQTAKGGSFFSRFKKGAKCLAATAGGAAVGAYADRNRPSRGAVIGVVVGGVGCQLF